MRTIYIIIIGIFILPAELWAQEDSILAVKVFSQLIDENGKLTKNKNLVSQETYNIKNQLHRTVYYDSNSRLSHYSFYFYDKDKLISVESYNSSDEIDSIRQYEYAQNGLKSAEKFYNNTNGELKLSETRNFSVIQGEPSLSEILNEKGKKIAKVSYKLQNGRISKVITKYKKGSRDDDLKLQTEFTTFRDNSIDSTSIQFLYYTKETDHNLRITVFDTLSGKAKFITLLDKKGDVIRKEEIRYNNVLKRPAGYGILDGENSYQKFLSYEYRVHVIDLGEQNRYRLPN